MTKEEVAAEFRALQSACAAFEAEQQDLEAHQVVLAKYGADLARIHARLDAVRILLGKLQAVRDE